MTERRQFIAGIAGISAVGIAGCSASEQTETAEEKVGVVLPPNSTGLFECSVLHDHDFAESSVTSGLYVSLWAPETWTSVDETVSASSEPASEASALQARLR